MPPQVNGNLIVKWVGLTIGLTIALMGAVATVYNTFATKAEVTEIKVKVDQLIWYHMQLQRTGDLPDAEGPHVAVTEEPE